MNSYNTDTHFLATTNLLSLHFEYGSEAHWRQWRVRNSNNNGNRFELLCPTHKLFLEILGHMFGDKIQRKENLPYGWLAHWKWATIAAKIRPVRVTRGDVDVVRDFRVIFLKLAQSRDFETSSRAVKKYSEDFQHVLYLELTIIVNC